MRKDWKKSTLGEVYDVRDGTHDSPKYIKSGYPLITSKNLKNGLITFDKVKFISKVDYDNINKRSKVDSGDVLFAMIGTIGNPVVIIEEPNYAIKNVALFKLGLNQNGKFLKYYLESDYVVKKMSKEAKGATQKFVGLGYLRNFPIILPLLQEQHQIVAILDEAFEAIDQAIANIEKNIVNAQELFQSKLNEIFSQRAEGWEERTLNEICEIKPPKKEAKEFLNENDLVSFVPMKDLGINSMYFSSTEEKELKSVISSYTYFKDGDVLLAKITPCFENGKLGIAKGLKNGVGFGSSEYIVYRPSDTILPEFLYHFLNQQTFRDQGSRVMTGAVGHKRIPKDFYEDFQINLPSIKTQKGMLLTLNEIDVQMELYSQLCSAKLESLEELKKSILQKAFAGELTNKATESLQLAAEPGEHY